MRKALLLCLLFFAVSCSKSGSTGSNKYRVGVDPAFYPCELGQQRTSVYCFMRDLCHKIGERNGVEVEVVQLSWDELFSELSMGRVDAVVSAAPQTIMNTNKYEFSHPLLRTGVVLVVPKKSDVSTLKGLKNRVVSLPRGRDEVEIIADHPETEFIFYNKFTSALELVVLGNMQGTLIPIIPATSYVKNLFHDSLKIVSMPLTSEGLRLVTPIENENSSPTTQKEAMKKWRREKLIPMFNEAITTFMDDGEYNKLLEKWTLSQ